MTIKLPFSRLAALFLAGGVVAWPAVAHTPELGILDELTKGSWTLRIRDDGPERQICVREGGELIQIRHRQPGCSRFIVRDEPNLVTIQYTCRGSGYGRTTIRRENNSLVQIQSQGIHQGAPFSLNAEARRTGPC